MVQGQDFTIAAASHTRVQIEIKETKPWKWIALAAVILLLISGVLWRRASRPRAVLGAKDTVVLGEFANSTGDAMFDETLRQGLAIQLSQSPYLSLISDQRISHTLRLMGQRPDARLTTEVARGICERTGSTAILQGSIAPLGSQYVLTLHARSCRTGEVLDQEQVQAARKEDVLSALDQVASRFRNRPSSPCGKMRIAIFRFSRGQSRNTPSSRETLPRAPTHAKQAAL